MGRKRKNEVGTIYIIHFAAAYKHARHYVGWTSNLEERLAAHRNGSGARLMEVISQAGLTWEVASTQPGSRSDERRLKQRKNTKLYCKICRSNHKERNYE